MKPKLVWVALIVMPTVTLGCLTYLSVARREAGAPDQGNTISVVAALFGITFAIVASKVKPK